MKKFTQEEYKVIHELLCKELQDLTHYSYMKYTDLDRLNKDLDLLNIIKEKVSERIK